MSFIMPQKSIVTAQGIKPIGEKREFKFDDGKANAEDIFAKLGDLSDIDLWYGQVLVGKFIRDKIGNLIVAPQTQREDRYQGKVGLVLKVGPGAFKSEPGRNFWGARVEPGEFVMFRYSDGIDLDIRCLDGTSLVNAKILEDAECRGKLRYPDRLW